MKIEPRVNYDIFDVFIDIIVVYVALVGSSDCYSPLSLSFVLLVPLLFLFIKLLLTLLLQML